MGQYADIYVAVKTSSKQQAINFLNNFLLSRVEGADKYEFPQYSSETNRELETVDELMSYLESEVKSEYNLYWRGTDNLTPNKHGMLFYTKDEALIFGISRDADIGGNLNTDNEDECLRLMKEYFQTDIGYITYEDTPIETFIPFEVQVTKLKNIRHHNKMQQTLYILVITISLTSCDFFNSTRICLEL